jgi:spermidine/putrescine transport system ATP-binding protein
MPGGRVELVDLVKRFDDVTAVDQVTLHIPSGEFFSLLGPSGCGKTTTLRLIAGFEQPSSGRIMLDDTDMVQTPPNRRNVNTVFQNYALFPFMTVAENVAFGLRYRDVRKDEAAEKVTEALALVQLEGKEQRRPSQLSGGQQQRVALARALVLNPAVLLLDEPLGALDAKLRKALQIELKALQETVGITFVYVTHDQEEALTMSDRIAVMNHGRIQQVGSPREIYESPSNVWVADFLGTSNVLHALVSSTGSEETLVRVGDLEMVAAASGGRVRSGDEVKLVVRPERVKLEAQGSSGQNRLPGMVERIVFQGSSTQVIVRLVTGEQLRAAVSTDDPVNAYDQGTPVVVHAPPTGLRVLLDEGAAPGESDPTQDEPATATAQI